jgi:hypothetical protein
MVFVGGTDILGWTNHGTDTDVYITGGSNKKNQKTIVKLFEMQ